MATAKVIKLTGNKANAESAEHHIEFPGGSVSVCRTSNENYWVHIYVHQNEILDDTMRQKKGVIEDIRNEQENHFAVLISTSK